MESIRVFVVTGVTIKKSKTVCNYLNMRFHLEIFNAFAV